MSEMVLLEDLLSSDRCYPAELWDALQDILELCTHKESAIGKPALIPPVYDGKCYNISIQYEVEGSNHGFYFKFDVMTGHFIVTSITSSDRPRNRELLLQYIVGGLYDSTCCIHSRVL